MFGLAAGFVPQIEDPGIVRRRGVGAAPDSVLSLVVTGTIALTRGISSGIDVPLRGISPTRLRREDTLGASVVG
jgi:hypothetical protein